MLMLEYLLPTNTQAKSNQLAPPPMLSTSLYRWIGSRFAFSWQLMLLIFANYVLNGQLFTGVELVSGGPPGFIFDLYNSLSVISVLFIFRFIKFKNTFAKSITAFTIASAISNFLPAFRCRISTALSMQTQKTIGPFY